MKVIIEVRSGLVQAVYSDNRDVDLIIYDFDSDCMSEDEEKEKEKEFEKDIERLAMIY